MSRLQKLDAHDLKTGGRIFHLLLLAKGTSDDHSIIEAIFYRLVDICPESIEIITGLSNEDFINSIRATQHNEDYN